MLALEVGKPPSNPRVFASPALQGGLYAAPDPSGFRAFAGRYRAKFGQELWYVTIFAPRYGAIIDSQRPRVLGGTNSVSVE